VLARSGNERSSRHVSHQEHPDTRGFQQRVEARAAVCEPEEWFGRLRARSTSTALPSNWSGAASGTVFTVTLSMSTSPSQH
jgi:hypothetical protein